MYVSLVFILSNILESEMASSPENDVVAAEMLEIKPPPAYQPYLKRRVYFTFLHNFYSCFLSLFYAFNLCVFMLCLYLVLSDRESYLLDVTTASDIKPPMRWVVHLGLASGILSMSVCSLGVLGLYGKVRNVLSVKFLIFQFLFGLAIVSLMQVAMGLIAREFIAEFDESTLRNYTYDLARNKYGIEEYAKPLMDKIQYYNDCCGSNEPEDYYFSQWFMQHRDTVERAFVPLSCCKMEEETSTFSEMKPIHHSCNIVIYKNEYFDYLVNTKGCGEVFSEKVLQYPALFEFLGLFMASLSVFVIVLVLLMVDKELYYETLPA